MPTCRKCLLPFPNYVVIDGKTRNIHSRRFCLNCSPFGRHNTRRIDVIPATEKTCTRCQIIKPISEFYVRKRSPEPTAYCKRCTIGDTLKRQRKFKQKCIEYKGGKCETCGYSTCIAALEFHHKDPYKKDFGISRARLTSFTEVIKQELDKCVMLCANCHREEHFRIDLMDLSSKG